MKGRNFRLSELGPKKAFGGAMQVADKKKKMQQLHRNPNNNIPNDIIVEILSRLPAKSLLRLRWTCKYWFDLITNRDAAVDFIKMHLHRSTSTISPYSVLISFCFKNGFGPDAGQLYLGYYYLNYKDTTHDVTRDVVSSEVNFIHHPSEHAIHNMLGSSNGLILMKSSHYSIVNLCILNPCTKEYRVLPQPLTSYHGGHNFGFGYDEIMDDYIVVKNLQYSPGLFSPPSGVEVYTLGRDSWRRIGHCPYQLSWQSYGVFLNGALYWMDYLYKNIISFDIGKEKFQHAAKTPKFSCRDHDLPKLQVFEGSLCVVLRTKPSQNSPGEIWVMKDMYTAGNNNKSSSSWTKLLTFPDKYLLTFPDMQFYPIKVLRYTRNGEILILNRKKDLVLYDPTDTSDLKSLWRIDDRESLVLEVYTESLVSLNSGTYTQVQVKNKENDTIKKKKIKNM